MRVPRGPKYRTLVSQVRCEGDRNHHQASRQFQYPITPGVGDPCWDSIYTMHACVYIPHAHVGPNAAWLRGAPLTLISRSSCVVNSWISFCFRLVSSAYFGLALSQ
jgi:hypothetical protein